MALYESDEKSRCRLWRGVAVVAGLLTWAVAPIVCWSVWGMNDLEDWLTKCVLPVGLLWNLLWLAGLVCLWRGRYRFAAVALLLAVAIGLVGNPTLGQRLADWHESFYPSYGPAHFSQPFDAIVVLGGCSARLPDGRAEVNFYGERIVATAAFWHAQKTARVIATGGRVIDGAAGEAEKNFDLLVSLGVPADRIVKVLGRNTHDEMIAIRQLLIDRPADFRAGRIGLVTSAFHMRRAMRLAERQGLDLVALPSGHLSVDRPWLPSDLVPDAKTVLDNSLLLKEWLAGMVGR